jgi:CRISPR/Cas system-associated exonuclease Cas4 (RecB family)
MPDGLAKLVGATFRDNDKLITHVARHLMLRSDVSGRRSDVIHPSEVAKADWCPRSTYYRMVGAEAEVIPPGLAMEIVFETGNEAHTKYQTWLWEMGIMRGIWHCLFCDLHWEDVSPHSCPRCEHGRDLLEYAEVPVTKPEYLLDGSMDGDVLLNDEWMPIECKTIGMGTLRYEAPELIKKYSYEHIDTNDKTRSGLDWNALWNGIRRPFPSHLRQGMIYLFCAGRKKMRYIYECKYLTVTPKEYVIALDMELIEERLESCLQVKKSLELGRPPKRPVWAEPQVNTCKRCAYFRTCWNGRDS